MKAPGNFSLWGVLKGILPEGKHALATWARKRKGCIFAVCVAFGLGWFGAALFRALVLEPLARMGR